MGQGPYGTKFVQHINNNGELLWRDHGIILSKNDTTDIRQIFEDNKGGAFLLGYVNYAQRIDDHGEFLWPFPFIKTGLPKFTRLWVYGNTKLNSQYIIIVGNYIGAQKISKNDGSILWGERGRLWKPTNMPSSGPTIITKNGNGGVNIFSYYFLQTLDNQGNYLYDTPRTVIDTTQFNKRTYAVSGEYAPGLGSYILYSISESSNEGKLILQRIDDDGNLPWGLGGITICDTNIFQSQPHSLIRVDDQNHEAFVFVEFQNGIFVTKVNLITGKDVSRVDHINILLNDFHLSVYPNPFTHSTNIKVDGLVSLLNSSLKIYNIEGKEVIDLTSNLKLWNLLIRQLNICIRDVRILKK